jgi:hypothetical protein
MSGIGLYALAQQQRVQAQRVGLELARAVATAVDAELRSTISVLESLATGHELDRGDLPAFRDRAQRVLDTQPHWAAVMLADPAGTRLVDTRYGAGDRLPPLAERQSLERAVHTRAPVVGVLARTAEDALLFPVRVPVLCNRELRYVLSAEVKPDEIRHADVGGIFVGRSADLRRIKETENVQTMIDGDLHHVVVSRHLRAFMRRQFVRGAEAVATAVEIDHHGALAAQGRRPDVELEHVLALPAVVPVLDEGLFDARPGMQGLRAVRAVDQRGIVICPRGRRFGGEPAILARGCLAVRDTFEGEDAAV